MAEAVQLCHSRMIQLCSHKFMWKAVKTNLAMNHYLLSVSFSDSLFQVTNQVWMICLQVRVIQYMTHWSVWSGSQLIRGKIYSLFLFVSHTKPSYDFRRLEIECMNHLFSWCFHILYLMYCMGESGLYIIKVSPFLFLKEKKSFVKTWVQNPFFWWN